MDDKFVINVDPEILPTTQEKPNLPAIKPELETKDRDVDLAYVRQNLKDLIDKGTEALDQLIAVSDSTRHPRAYEALSVLLAQLVTTNKELVELHKASKSLKEEERAKETPKEIHQTVVFTGTTTQMDDIIKKFIDKSNA